MTTSHDATPSATTAASQRFVAEHMARAVTLGDHLADLAETPSAFLADIHKGLALMADPASAEGIRLVAPTIGPVLGVRLPGGTPNCDRPRSLRAAAGSVRLPCY